MLTFKLSIALKVCAARDVNRMVIPNVTLTRRVTVPLSFMPDHLELRLLRQFYVNVNHATFGLHLHCFEHVSDHRR